MEDDVDLRDGLASARERFLRKPFRIDDLERERRAELVRCSVGNETSGHAADRPGRR